MLMGQIVEIITHYADLWQQKGPKIFQAFYGNVAYFAS